MFAALHDTDPADRFVHLGIRADLPIRPAFDDITDRLDALEAAGRIAGYDVTTWPAHVRFDVEPPGASVLDRFHRFWTWADHHGVHISPAFVIRQGTTMAGEHERVLDTPVVFAWVTDDRRILAMAPCSDGDRTATVDDLVAALEPVSTAPEARAASA